MQQLTIRDLVKHLKTLDQDLPVFYTNNEFGPFPLYKNLSVTENFEAEYGSIFAKKDIRKINKGLIL